MKSWVCHWCTFHFFEWEYCAFNFKIEKKEIVSWLDFLGGPYTLYDARCSQGAKVDFSSKPHFL